MTPTLWRDRLAAWLCNLILRHVASPWYRNMVTGIIRYGMWAAERDEEADRREARGEAVT